MSFYEQFFLFCHQEKWSASRVNWNQNCGSSDVTNTISMTNWDFHAGWSSLCQNKKNFQGKWNTHNAGVFYLTTHYIEQLQVPWSNHLKCNESLDCLQVWAYIMSKKAIYKCLPTALCWRQYHTTRQRPPPGQQAMKMIPHHKQEVVSGTSLQSSILVDFMCILSMVSIFVWHIRTMTVIHITVSGTF